MLKIRNDVSQPSAYDKDYADFRKAWKEDKPIAELENLFWRAMERHSEAGLGGEYNPKRGRQLLRDWKRLNSPPPQVQAPKQESKDDA